MDDLLVQKIKNNQGELRERFHVDSLSIFGSVARGTDTPNSDVDILVKYQKTPGFFEFLDLKTYLEDLMGRRVDLVTEGALKKQLREQVLQEAKRVA